MCEKGCGIFKKYSFFLIENGNSNQNQSSKSNSKSSSNQIMTTIEAARSNRALIASEDAELGLQMPKNM